MSTSDVFYEVLADFAVQEQNSPSISKGEIVKVITKGPDYFKIEKDGIIIKIPSQYLHLCSSVSSDNQNQANVTSQIDLKNAVSQILPQDSKIPSKTTSVS
ncbi:MAG: hypothetical protein EZS28_012453 [Streblomastix strix]|uniref:SH3 domain-containing protein n=1 Tax=Streblomastix strix TaxID=222440 RepID=A0A5J4WBU0_9EUKA|nr:MAG: hypothetical protein EZS28_012453 [Streblomastix strix]